MHCCAFNSMESRFAEMHAAEITRGSFWAEGIATPQNLLGWKFVPIVARGRMVVRIAILAFALAILRLAAAVCPVVPPSLDIDLAACAYYWLLCAVAFALIVSCRLCLLLV